MLARPGRLGAPRTYWLVMRLLIALLVLSTCAACAGAEADPAGRSEQVSTMPVTFPDGSATVLRFDPALGLDRMKVRPYQWGRIGDSMRDFDVTPGAQPARLPGIRLRFGPWHLRIWDYRPGDDHAADADAEAAADLADAPAWNGHAGRLPGALGVTAARARQGDDHELGAAPAVLGRPAVARAHARPVRSGG